MNKCVMLKFAECEMRRPMPDDVPRRALQMVIDSIHCNRWRLPDCLPPSRAV